MKLIALLLGLFLEKISTRVFGLHEQRWLDFYFDQTMRLMGKRTTLRSYLVALLAIIVLIAPIALINFWLVQSDNTALLLALSVLILFLALGPRDLNAEVDEFVEAIEKDDEASTRRVAKELLEFDPPEDREKLGAAVATAIFVQSNNRTFAVVLWFVLLGPAGAWAFRVTDLFRRRASYESQRFAQQAEIHDAVNQDQEVVSEDNVELNPVGYLQPLNRIHGALAWLPSRLAAMSFALAGSFEPAKMAWKAYYNQCAEEFFDVNDDVVGCAGCGALGRQIQEDMLAQPDVGARSAMSLIQRSMIVWLVVIALLTLAGASIL